jgi:hypothetical protein
MQITISFFPTIFGATQTFFFSFFLIFRSIQEFYFFNERLQVVEPNQ